MVAQEVMEVNQAMDAHEGCNIFGWLDLQRVAGNFRVSVHVEDFFALTRVWHVQVFFMHPAGCMSLCQQRCPPSTGECN